MSPNRRPATLAAALALMAASATAPARASAGPADADPGLPDRAMAVLRTYCYGCHGLTFKVPGYDVTHRAGLVAARPDADPYITPGDPSASELWNRFDEMPPKGKKPSAEERATIQAWIAAGAEFPADAPARPFVSDLEVQSAIRDHLRGLDPADRPHQRYFSLVNLHNNPRRTALELMLARAGVSKMLNSLSRKPGIVVPGTLGPGQTLLAVDLRRLGWDNQRDWTLILRHYPYGLKFTGARDRALREAASEVEALIGPDVPLAEVRADWFLDTAGRPPLYHALLEIPATAEELERQLRVDTRRDFLDDTLRRAGFAQSGVSKQMRLVDRHDSNQGYYWKSYDFRRGDRAVNLFLFPLGPEFPGNPFADQAFTHAGGEIIFSLPNRLQGYMLVDAAGARIDEGPAEIVFDSGDASGNSTILNGMSCMSCHKNGMIPVRDRVREGVALSGTPRDKVERLFPPEPEMAALLRRDGERFLEALDEAVGPFLRDAGATRAADYPEPIIPIAKLFQADLDLAAAAAELNLPDGAALAGRIRANPRLERLGLAALLAEGGAINRAEWGAVGKGTSAYQRACSEIDRGTPRIIFAKD